MPINNIWVIHRAAMVTEKKVCCKPAPIVMQFDPSGKALQGWGGPGDGYEWPAEKNEHGIFVNLQVFRIDGTFVKEAFIRRDTKETAGTVSSLAFSADPAQQFIYSADQTENVILILDRQTLQERGTIGRLGRHAGQFVSPHNIATDSNGNLYVAEDVGGQRVQKFAIKGTVGTPRQ